MSVDIAAVNAALADPLDVVTRLGLVGPRDRVMRQHGGIMIRCFVHGDRSPSLSIRRGERSLACRCFGCGWTADLLGLIAEVNGLSTTTTDFPEVLEIAQDLAGIPADAGQRSTKPRVQQRGPEVMPERDYPPTSEVAALLASCVSVSSDASVRALLESRALDPKRIADLDVARALPADAAIPRWASWQGRTWTALGHRLIVPMVDSAGVVRSVRAWRVGDGESPKRLPPGGHRARELVLTCPAARAVLAGNLDGLPHSLRIVIAEGEPDALSWMTRFSDADEDAPIVIGVLSGSWSDDFAARIPDGAHVVLRTHADATGERYAAEIARSLNGRCRVVRPKSFTERAAA